MTQKHDISVTIDEEGNVHLELKGFKGKGCGDLTKELEEALGMVTASKRTAEYYEDEDAGVQVTVGGDESK
jgi:hypothetical protein